MKGLIALDIDGTITPNHHYIPREVVDYFSQLYSDGWRFIFITGRTYSWGHCSLKDLSFPYYFAVQNGALIFEMPSETLLSKKYLDKTVFPAMEAICAPESTDYVIYAGYESQDHCFFRPDHFSPEMLAYLKERCRKLEEVWEPVDSFETIHLGSFPSLKCIADYPTIVRIARKIENELQLHVPIIKDPMGANYYVAQATHPQVHKGQALLDLIALLGGKEVVGHVIAAGDDNNDVTMLAEADKAVVMASAPHEMIALADVVAPPVTVNGIIQGLTQAIALLTNKHISDGK